MVKILRSLPPKLRRTTTTLDIFSASIKHVRDRGLDHAVEREKNLKPLINLKNLIKSEPTKSVPLSLIKTPSLQLPTTRPLDFIRKYPLVFQEHHPANIPTLQPHVKLTPEALALDSEETLLYDAVNYKQELADRLFKLLMLCRKNKIPLDLLDRIKWDMGLPQDYVKAVVPEFPDYFRVKNDALELVCWSDELAVSAIEKKGENRGFFVTYSKGFEMDKKYKKWVEEWGKLSCISPYRNVSEGKSDEGEKWAVGVLHEVLSLFVPKKADREAVFWVGEWLGLRSRFKRAILNHPGIFYVSSKNWTHTVVLKEAYKRGALVDTHPLMNMRFKYVHLMNQAKEESKLKSGECSCPGVKECDAGEADANSGAATDEDQCVEVCDLSSDDNKYDDDYAEEEEEHPKGRLNRKSHFVLNKPLKCVRSNSTGTRDRGPSRYFHTS